jgi:hypothetical protein
VILLIHIQNYGQRALTSFLATNSSFFVLQYRHNLSHLYFNPQLGHFCEVQFLISRNTIQHHRIHSSAHFSLSKICSFLYFPVFCMLLECASSFHSLLRLRWRQECTNKLFLELQVGHLSVTKLLTAWCKLEGPYHNSSSCCQLFTADTKV